VPAFYYAAVVLLALVVIGLPFASAWNESPDLGHGWALPWLIGWLLWERRGAVVLQQTGRLPWWCWPGLAALGGGLVFVRLLLGAYPLLPTALWTLGLMFVAFALSATALLGGAKAVRALAVPVVLVLAGLPWPSAVENAVVLPLRELLTSITVEVLNIAGVPSLADGAVIQIPGGTVGVDEACGGMRSLQASIMIALFVGEAAWLRWGRRFALLGLSVLTAVAGNLFRVGLLTCAAHTGGEARLHAWHDPAGYLALVCTLVVIGGLGWRWGGRAAILEPSSGGNWEKAPRVSRGKLAWAVAALMIVSAVELSVRHWYGVKIKIIAAQSEWRVAWPVHADGFREDKLGPVGQDTLRADDYEAASWKTPDGSPRSAYFIEWRTGQKARFMPSMHNPEICLPMIGSQLVGRFDVAPVRVGRFTLPFSGYEFLREGRPTYVFSILWDMDEGRAFVPPPDMKGWMTALRFRWADVMARRERARVDVCTYQVIGANSREEAEERFRREVEGGFLKEITPGLLPSGTVQP
jgi:exosortase